MLGYTTPSFGATRAPRAPRAAAPAGMPRPNRFTSDPAFPSLTAGAQPAAPPTFAPRAASMPPPDSVVGNSGGDLGGQYSGQHTFQPPAATPTAPAVTPYNYDADPVLQQILGFSTSGRANATSDALAAKKKLAVDFNDADLATALGDPATAQAAQGNQFGVLEALKRNYQQGANQLDENLNDNGNLFYSGYRGVQQGNLAHDYQGQQKAAAGQEQDLLGKIVTGLRDALLGYDTTDANARRDAAGNAIDGAVGAGVDPGAGVPVDFNNAGTNGYGTVDPTGAGAVTDPSGIASLLFPTADTPLIGGAVGGGNVDPLIAALLAPNQRKLLNPLLG